MDLTRQKDLVDEKIFNQEICIIGAGGIGSFTCLTLAKMGFKNITVYDFDTVETHNVPNQFYREKDLGKSKVEALQEIVKEFTGTEIKIHNKRFGFGDKPLGVVIMAVDSLEMREEIYRHIADNKKDIPAFLDGRMGKHQAEIYTIKTDKDIPLYLTKLLTPDGKGLIRTDGVKCTEKAIIYNVLFIASMISNQLKLMLENKFYKKCIIMDLENNSLFQQ